MARKVKCPYCENQLDKDEAVSHKKKYYHQSCFETWQNEKEDRASLLSYICDLYRVDVPPMLILKQIKDYQEEHKFKLKGIELALRYFHEILDSPVNFEGGIGIVPYIYEQAKQDYIKRMKIAESFKNVEESEEVTVYIDLNQSKRKSKSIDITAI